MSIKVNHKILSIPPHLSLGWESIASLHTEKEENSNRLTLVVSLYDDSRVKVPHMLEEDVLRIFSFHEQHLESEKDEDDEVEASSFPTSLAQNPFDQPMQEIIGFPFKLGIGGGLESLGATMQHNAQQANLPNLPEEMLNKVAQVAKVICGGELDMMPQPVDSCNCTYCQIARAVHGGAKSTSLEEEAVSDADLSFRTWDIAQTGDKLYTTTNPLDSNEKYQVFLGEPVGCTCGHKNCEHIKAVLNS